MVRVHYQHTSLLVNKFSSTFLVTIFSLLYLTWSFGTVLFLKHAHFLTNFSLHTQNIVIFFECLIFSQKSRFLGPTIKEIPQQNWHQYYPNNKKYVMFYVQTKALTYKVSSYMPSSLEGPEFLSISCKIMLHLTLFHNSPPFLKSYCIDSVKLIALSQLCWLILGN